jgi:hypothetical protein
VSEVAKERNYFQAIIYFESRSPKHDDAGLGGNNIEVEFLPQHTSRQLQSIAKINDIMHQDSGFFSFFFVM